MAVIIYGMEMPESCGRCPFRHKGSHGIYYCMAMEGEYVDDQMHEYEDERHPECPLASMEFDCGAEMTEERYAETEV